MSNIFTKVFGFVPKGKILYITDKSVSHITLTPISQIIIVTSALILGCFLSYHVGRYSKTSAIINAKNEEVNRIKQINNDLTRQINVIIDDVENFNSYLENDDKIKSKKYSTSGGQKISHNHQKHKLSFQNNYTKTTYELNKVKNRLSTLILKTKSSLQRRINHFSGLLKSSEVYQISVAEVLPAATNKVFENYSKIASSSNTNNEQFASQGGPFIPYNNKKQPSNELPVVSFADLFSSFKKSTNVNGVFTESLKVLKNLESTVSFFPLGKPMDYKKITSGFGRRIDPKIKVAAVHHGLDMVGDQNAKIYTPSSGFVTRAGFFNGYGNYIEIHHGNGVVSAYGHLKKIFVNPGDKVNVGDIIGIQGSTGRSTGDHLHYEIRLNNVFKNPINFVSFDKNHV